MDIRIPGGNMHAGCWYLREYHRFRIVWRLPGIAGLSFQDST